MTQSECFTLRLLIRRAASVAESSGADRRRMFCWIEFIHLKEYLNKLYCWAARHRYRSTLALWDICQTTKYRQTHMDAPLYGTIYLCWNPYCRFSSVSFLLPPTLFSSETQSRIMCSSHLSDLDDLPYQEALNSLYFVTSWQHGNKLV